MNDQTSRAFALRWLLVGGLLVGCLSTSACGEAPADGPASGSRAEAASLEAVRGVLDRQVAAWNEGNLDRFMAGYARTDSLRFASGGDVSYGWQTLRDRYGRSYADAAAMGTLAFDDLDVRLLGPNDALAFGRWRLTRAAGFPPASGLFTLVLHRRAEGWRVVHDHTSSAPPPAADSTAADTTSAP